MASGQFHELSIHDRRTAFRLAYANALLWSLGNGMASTSLIFYLARSYGARGVAAGIIFAAPSFVGTLRLGTSAILARVGDRRRFSIAGYFVSSLCLIALPLVVDPQLLPGRGQALAALVLLWSFFHLAEYVATISLWSWLRDLAPGPIRGRFIGRRERWILVGRIVGMLAAGLFTWWWQWQHGDENSQPVFAYKAATLVGGLTMLAALVPLARMPSLPFRESHSPARAFATLLAPLVDRRYRRLLTFGCWFSLFNGITSYAQFVYFAGERFLHLALLWLLGLECVMRLGQSALAPFVGRWTDRLGNRPVMIAAQIPVALALLFFAAATPERPWWIAGAWLLWIAYVGLNVGLPGTMLKLAPPGAASNYIAVYFTLSGLCYGVSSVAGGVLVDQLSGNGRLAQLMTRLPLAPYPALFIAGALLRLGGVFWLARLIEPGARRWLDGLKPRD